MEAGVPDASSENERALPMRRFRMKEARRAVLRNWPLLLFYDYMEKIREMGHFQSLRISGRALFFRDTRIVAFLLNLRFGGFLR